MKILFAMLLILLSSCSLKQSEIPTNSFIQSDYNYHCLSDDKTFTQIILCYQAQDKAEKAQNEVTNKLISESLKK